MASGSGWDLWVWLVGVVVRRYIHFLILLIPTLFAAASLLFVHYLNKKMLFFSFLVINLIIFSHSISRHTGDYGRAMAAI